MQLFKIKADKRDNQIDIEIDGNYSPVSLSYGLKDMCLFLAIEIDESILYSKNNGQFIIEATSIETDRAKISIDNISYLELKKTLEVLRKGTTLFPYLMEEVIGESLTASMQEHIPRILSVLTEDNKQAVIHEIRADLEFYCNKALPAIKSVNSVNFYHFGFSFDEIKNVIQNVYLRISQQYSLMYKFDFIKLKMQ